MCAQIKVEVGCLFSGLGSAVAVGVLLLMKFPMHLGPSMVAI